MPIAPFFDTLIDATTLAEHLDDPRWIVVDTRFDLAQPTLGEQQYVQSHVRGAVYAHLDRDLSAKDGGAVNGGRHPLPTRERVCERFARLGVRDDMQVVVYDAAGGMIAARLWWMLRWIGHPAVAVLDGGWPAWQRAGGPIEAVTRVKPPGVLSLRPSLVELATVDEVVAALGTPGTAIIDARAPDRYDGSNETIDPVGGHIPGAINAFFRGNLDADGRFKSADALRERFAASVGERDTIHQCGSGVTACHNVLATQIAGLAQQRLYAGSWSEWVEDPTRPVARGAQPAGT